MKLLTIISKNFKILFRSKSSAFVVSIGPLLIIAMIALAFSNSHEYQITVGVVTPNLEGLTQQFIDQLKLNYTVINYQTIEQCNGQIKSRTTNICIGFPENFVVSNEITPEIMIYVDQSRINIVESIISSVSSSIGLKTDELSKSFTEKLIDAVDTSSTETKANKEIISSLKSSSSTMSGHTNTIKSKSEASGISGAADNMALAYTISLKVVSFTADTQDLLEDLDDFFSTAESAGVSTTAIKAKANEIDDELAAGNSSGVAAKVTELKQLLGSVKTAVEAAEKNIDSITDSASSIKTELTSIDEKINNLEQSMQKIESKVNSIEIKSAENIVNPFMITVNPILASSNRSTYMFPYFIVLIILFVGVMLSSTLVVMEKKSRAFFRNFTTPTPEIYHIIARFITNLIVLVVQLTIILIAAFFYLKIPFLDNILITLLVLLLSITFFVFMGMLIGYMFKTQEGTTIASISVGSLFIFLSNIILPVESFSDSFKRALLLNPYMLCSELLKKATLFNIPFAEVKKELLLLSIYIFFMVVFVFVFQKISFSRMFSGFSYRKVLLKPHITQDNTFQLENGTHLKNIDDLDSALKKMSDEEFKEYVNGKNNEFALWIRDTFKEKKLAKKVKKARNIKDLLEILKQAMIEQENKEKSK